MNFNELQQIVKYIRKSMPCPNCKKTYYSQDIEVLSTFDDQGLYHLNCHNCQNQLLVHVTVSEQETKLEEKGSPKQQIEAKPAMLERKHHSIISTKKDVSLNDVIDVHQFLNSFDGDFKTLFSKK